MPSIPLWVLRTLAHLSHMSNIKRQKEPTAIGPTCFQYPEMWFRSCWSCSKWRIEREKSDSLVVSLLKHPYLWSQHVTILFWALDQVHKQNELKILVLNKLTGASPSRRTIRTRTSMLRKHKNLAPKAGNILACYATRSVLNSYVNLCL